ncbi:tail sheath stabilizer, partial [Vibrio phage 1.244.A._10N.261.54.C3]
MMSLFDKHYYHKSTRKYGHVLSLILSSMQVNTEGKLVQIPLSYVGGDRDKLDGQQITNGVMPRATLKFIRYEPSDDRQLTNNQQRIKTTGNANQLMRIPMGFQFRMVAVCKKQDEQYQIFEQMIPAFTPSLDFKMVDNEDVNNQQNIKVTLESYDISDDWEGDGENHTHYNVEFTFTLHGYLYRRTIDNGGPIDKVYIDISVFPEAYEGVQAKWDNAENTDHWIEVQL